jgi:AGCS family alanine or glycine:cation symporter
MFYIEKGLGIKWLGIIFAILLALSAFGIGSMVQANSISDVMYDTFKIPLNFSGLIISVICFTVIIGGSNKIMNVTEIIVPIMAMFYISGTIICLVVNWRFIPDALHNIITSAFSYESIIGGSGGFLFSKAIKCTGITAISHKISVKTLYFVHYYAIIMTIICFHGEKRL